MQSVRADRPRGISSREKTNGPKLRLKDLDAPHASILDNTANLACLQELQEKILVSVKEKSRGTRLCGSLRAALGPADAGALRECSKPASPALPRSNSNFDSCNKPQQSDSLGKSSKINSICFHRWRELRHTSNLV